jgi:hypothetical protein
MYIIQFYPFIKRIADFIHPAVLSSIPPPVSEVFSPFAGLLMMHYLPFPMTPA